MKRALKSNIDAMSPDLFIITDSNVSIGCATHQNYNIGDFKKCSWFSCEGRRRLLTLTRISNRMSDRRDANRCSPTRHRLVTD